MIDFSIWAGLLTGWSFLLTMTKPLLAVAQFIGELVGIDVWGILQVGYWVLTAVWWGWQWTERGRSGQSVGQRLIGVRIVDEKSREPIGPGRSLIRSVTHFLDAVPFGVGFLRPTWSRPQQTWADKIHHTIAIR